MEDLFCQSVNVCTSLLHFSCQKLPDLVEVGVSRHELETESQHSSHLEEENRTLKIELEKLHQAVSKGDEVDYQQEKVSLEKEMKHLELENIRLKDQLSLVRCV